MNRKFKVMRALKGQLLIVFGLFLSPLFAQQFEFTWLDNIDYSNQKDGFFAGFINTSETYVYVLNSNYAVSPLNKNDKLKLIAYDKNTMREAASVSLKGYPENEAAKKEYEPLDYYKTVVLADQILVFWTKLTNTDSTKTEELYVESYAVDLDPGQKLTKIYTSVQQTDGRQSDFAPSSIVVASNKERSDVLIGAESCASENSIVFKYVILNKQLKTSRENEVSLQSACTAGQSGITAVYDYAEDGNIYIRTNVMLTREQYQQAPQNSPKSYLALTVVNPSSQKQTTLNMQGEHKTITDFSYIVTGTKTKVFGFFGDLLKDPSGIDKQGVFHATIDSDTLADVGLSYSYFEKTSLNKLFPKTRGGRKKIVEKPNEEELNTRFDIENIFPMEDGSFVLFFNRKYNYTEITSKSGGDGRNVYKTDHYCEKNNVSAIRIADNGKIMWTSNVDRTITYKGTDIADLKIIYKWNKFYVIYGTENEKATKKERKKASPFRDNIDYATFDPGSGRAKKNNLPVNERGLPQKARKTVDPSSITVFDGNYYFSKMTVKQKAVWYVANVLFFPSIYYSVLSGNTKHASAELGVLRLVDEKAEKKAKKK